MLRLSNSFVLYSWSISKGAQAFSLKKHATLSLRGLLLLCYSTKTFCKVVVSFRLLDRISPSFIVDLELESATFLVLYKHMPCSTGVLQ